MGRVHQEDASKLKVTISGNLDSSNPETDDGTIPEGEVRETQLTLFHAYDDNAFDWRPVYLHGATHRLKTQTLQESIARTVTNATAANLKAEVTPSGDMAREHYYDRTPLAVMEYYSATLGSHSLTTRETYTVPANKSAQHSVIMGAILIEIATALKQCNLLYNVNIGGAGMQTYARVSHYEASGRATEQTITITYFIADGDSVEIQTNSNDTIDHAFRAAILLTEFDE